MARELTRWDFQKDQFGRTWRRGRRGLEWENFRIDLEWRRRRHAPRTVRNVVYEGDVSLAELDGEARAFAFVHELISERDNRERLALEWWRVQFNVWKGRELVAQRSTIFVKAATLEHAAQRARQVADDDYSGRIELLLVRQASAAEAQQSNRTVADEAQRATERERASG
jgi:hypothetical protein